MSKLLLASLIEIIVSLQRRGGRWWWRVRWPEEQIPSRLGRCHRRQRHRTRPVDNSFLIIFMQKIINLSSDRVRTHELLIVGLLLCLSLYLKRGHSRPTFICFRHKWPNLFLKGPFPASFSNYQNSGQCSGFEATTLLSVPQPMSCLTILQFFINTSAWRHRAR